VSVSEDYLFKLLRHAQSKVSYYSKIEPNISKYPVVNKIIIRAQFDDFQAKNYADQPKINMTTSGSTGTPFTVYQDLNKKARNHADTLYFGELAGYQLGNKLAYLKIWVKQKMEHPLKYRLQNIVPIDVIHLNDTLISELIQRMEHEKETWGILGYVSALEQIIQYLDKNNQKRVHAKIESVITMSEGLSNETKMRLEELLGCPVVSRYSNLENGIIAQQERKKGQAFLVNTASYHVEIMDMIKEERVPNGQLGRIVVTDLFNYAMPMIRYDTGDLGVLAVKGGKTYLETVEGRKLDVLYDTKGEMVSSYIMYKNMWQYTEIEQYQLIQIHIRSYEFKINCPTGFKKEEQLVAEFKKYLGQDADFKVTYVREIPLLDSGKRRKTVNLYYK
jgi:phenylacetate-CoA ligase